MFTKNRDAHRLTGSCEDADKGSQPDHVPAIEASRRAGAPAGWTFSKHQGTLVLKELSNWSKDKEVVSALRGTQHLPHAAHRSGRIYTKGIVPRLPPSSGRHDRLQPR